MGKEVVRSLWIGERLSRLERICISSFLKNGHRFVLYAYDELDNVPDAVELADAEHIIPKQEVFMYPHHKSYAAFANLFRYVLLEQFGGYWVDTDIVCLRPLPKDLSYIFAAQQIKDAPIGNREPAPINNCLIRVPPGSSIMRFCREEAEARDPKLLRWGETGPHLLSHAVQTFGLEDYVRPPKEFCPIPWWRWRDIAQTNPSRSVRTLLENGAYTLHLWNECWRRAEVDKDMPLSDTSLFEEMATTYL